MIELSESSGAFLEPVRKWEVIVVLSLPYQQDSRQDSKKELVEAY